MSLCDEVVPLSLHVSTTQTHPETGAQWSDNELNLIQKRVQRWLGNADTKPQFATLVDRFRNCRPPKRTRKRTLNLVAHSRGTERYLALGTWVIDADDKVQDQANFVFLNSLRAQLHQLGIEEIRLLGCQTGWSLQGRRSNFNISKALEIDVCGTTDLISVANFDARGLTTATAMRCASEEPLPDVVQQVVLPRAPSVKPLDLAAVPIISRQDLMTVPGVSWGRTILEDEVADDRIHVLVGDENRKRGVTLPGLLLEPTHEYWIPFEGRYRPVQLLAEGNLLRVYSKDLSDHGVPPYAKHYRITNPYHSAVYPVERPDDLVAFLSSRPGRPIDPQSPLSD